MKSEYLGAECVIEKLINAGIVELASLNELENIPQRVKDYSFSGDGEERTISLPCHGRRRMIIFYLLMKGKKLLFHTSSVNIALVCIERDHPNILSEIMNDCAA